jgi:excisionase family DNA binding protein
MQMLGQLGPSSVICGKTTNLLRMRIEGAAYRLPISAGKPGASMGRSGAMATTADEVRGYTPKQVAAMLNVSRKTVYALMRRGRLGYCQVGGLKIIRPEEVDRFLDESGRRESR